MQCNGYRGYDCSLAAVVCTYGASTLPAVVFSVEKLPELRRANTTFLSVFLPYCRLELGLADGHFAGFQKIFRRYTEVLHLEESTRNTSPIFFTFNKFKTLNQQPFATINTCFPSVTISTISIPLKKGAVPEIDISVLNKAKNTPFCPSFPHINQIKPCLYSCIV